MNTRSLNEGVYILKGFMVFSLYFSLYFSYVEFHLMTAHLTLAKRVATMLAFFVVNLHLLPNYEFRMKLLAFLSISIFVDVGWNNSNSFPALPEAWVPAIECRHPCGALVLYENALVPASPCTIRKSSYSIHARVHGDLSVSIRLAFPYECGSA